jgi:hypothetical protein
MPREYRIHGREYLLPVDAGLNAMIQPKVSLYNEDLRRARNKKLERSRPLQDDFSEDLTEDQFDEYCQNYGGAGIQKPLTQLDHNMAIERGERPRPTKSPLASLRGFQQSHEQFQVLKGVVGEGAGGVYLEKRLKSVALIRLVGFSPDFVNRYTRRLPEEDEEETVLVMTEVKAASGGVKGKKRRREPEDLLRNAETFHSFLERIKCAASGDHLPYEACLVGVVIHDYQASSPVVDIELAVLRIDLGFYRKKPHQKLPSSAFAPHDDPGDALRAALCQQQANRQADGEYEGGLTRITQQLIVFYAEWDFFAQRGRKPTESEIIDHIRTQAQELGAAVVEAWENAPGRRGFDKAVIRHMRKTSPESGEPGGKGIRLLTAGEEDNGETSPDTYANGDEEEKTI